MTLKEIQDLIKFVAKSGATEVSLELEDLKLNIKTGGKKKNGEPAATIVQQIPVAAAPQAVQAPVQAIAPAAPVAETPAAPVESKDDESKFLTIKSPIIGTFYRKPSPDKDAFASVGDTVKAGDVVCIVEAMKLFNEIESEVSGKIVKVLVDDMSPVEFDQPLFLVDPS
ncbi:MAG: acetyl-CoA carboxylase biotin carboxyl carrier protein [Flavobacteriales bacterium]|jgi:acetyl-CoA carboxylase biotin carboxyl carrier protein|nr:acetyl-CoA carboxylase biotin carboxyl carrier protein [Flavobacteriales bacterium]